jgi:predicted nucleotidyltransferase
LAGQLSSDLKSKVAREAATLLYFGAEKEYKQAKTRAAQTLGTHFLPSNLDVALELDKIADETEGEHRKERLVEMRKEALQIMKILDAYYPLLIGSVWRGNIRKGSDIDIAVYADDPEEIVGLLKDRDVTVLKTAWTTVNKHGRTLASLHVHAETSGKHGVEIVVRASEEKEEKRKCEIFGDEIKGLKTKNLEKLLKSNATQKFVPA